ncbi:hypothetical protein NED98_13155 [Sphingomonas sp. MMSM20]|uniref:hypothetical protein n=1 Tax=Sphingomonas lycopersici TaxID=2951807 RepID=UPI002238C3C2|nr:hypothetical protein [Sphingomonas lycopersici]MCW6531194.1 hypothetical protein [Sphingomonas lycopersici]
MATDQLVDQMITNLVNMPKNISDSLAQGQQRALDQQDATLRVQQLQRQADRDAQYDIDADAYLQNQTPQQLATLVTKYPDKYQALKQGYEVMDEPRQQGLKVQFGSLYNAADNGRPDLLANQIDDLITAEKKAGIDTTDAQAMSARLRSNDPDTVKAATANLRNFAAVHLSALDSKFAQSLGINQGGDGHFKSSPLGIFDDRTGSLKHAISEKLQIRTVRNADGTTSVVGVGGDGEPVVIGSESDDLPPGASSPPGAGGSQPLSIRLNNPGAIRYNPSNQWVGQVGQQNGFVQFDTPENGQRAHRRLIANQIRAGYDTPLTWAQHYAPASDGNDPQAYAQTIAKGLGIGVNDKMPIDAVPRIAALSAKVEAGGSPANSGSGAPSQSSGAPTALVGVAGTKPQPAVRVLYTSAPKQAALDASTIDFYAQKVAAGGDMPQLGMGKDAATLRQAILQRAAQIQLGRGMSGGDSNLLHADTKSAGMALTALQKTRNSLDPFIKTFDGAADQVRKLAPQGVGGSIPVFNRWIQAGRQAVTGDPAVSKFNVAINAVANENAKIMSGASGGAVTSDSARHEAMSLINNAMTLDQLNSVLDQMHTDSQLRIRSLDDRATTLRGIISGNSAAGPAPNSSPGRQTVPAKAAPAIGAVVRGYKFRGGNPADRNSWVKVQ